MKSISIFIAIFLHLSWVFRVKKNIDLPVEINTSFIKDFPAASKINWERKGVNYKAHVNNYDLIFQ